MTLGNASQFRGWRFAALLAGMFAVGLVSAPVSAQQPTQPTTQDTTHRARTRRRTARSTRRIPVRKEAAAPEAPPAPVAPPVNQDSIDRANRMRDSLAAAERARQDSIDRANRVRDSIAAAERARQDSIARAEQARRDSIARADSIERAKRMAGAGFHIGVGAGLSFPVSDLTNAYKMGWNVTVPVGYDFPGIFGIRVDGAYDALSGKDTTGGSYGGLRIPNFSADLKLRFPIGEVTHLYLLGGYTGAKAYSSGGTTAHGFQTSYGNASFKSGYNLGGGLLFGHGGHGLFLESRYMNISSESNQVGNVRWVPLIIGLQY